MKSGEILTLKILSVFIAISIFAAFTACMDAGLDPVSSRTPYKVALTSSAVSSMAAASSGSESSDSSEVSSADSSKASSKTTSTAASKASSAPAQSSKSSSKASSNASSKTASKTSSKVSSNAPAPTPSYVQNTQFINEVIELVNIERAKESLPPLEKGNEYLDAAAALRAEEIIELFSHTRPDGSNWNTAFEECGVYSSYDVAQSGENLAGGQATPEAVVQAWMDSPGHRANIMSGNFTHVSIGYIYEEDSLYGHHWSQSFIQAR